MDWRGRHTKRAIGAAAMVGLVSVVLIRWRNSRGLLRRPPAGLLRLGLRFPVLLYRAHLGWLLGHRFLMLTHRGRRSGIARQTVLEVVRYDPATRASIVVSAWGERADWYRNILASPALAVETGRDRYEPEQRILSAAEVEDELRRYVLAHPWAARILMKLLKAGTDTGEGLLALAGSARMVAFRPRTS